MNRQTTQTAAYFDQAAPEWDRRSVLREETVRAIFDAAGHPGNEDILDVGCGTGILFPVLLSYQPRHVTGLDLSACMIQEAKRKFQESGRLSIVHGDYYSFEGGPFDYITVYNAYPHFQDRRRFVRQAHKLLKPGGRLLVFHDLSRERINTCHNRSEDVRRISSPLLRCEEEALHWRGLFHVDLSMDTEEQYMISGVRHAP